MDVSSDGIESDRQLLRRYAEKADARAFETLVNRNMRLIYSAAARRVGDRHLAEDVTQAVFVILAKKAGAVSRATPVSRWLLSTTRQVAANAIKSEARRQRREAIVGRQQGVNRVGASADPADVLVWQEASAQLDDAVLKLPGADRHAVLLRYFEEKPVREIAQTMQLSEGAVKQRLARALAKLRRRLARLDLVAGSLTSEQFIHLLERHVVTNAPPGLAHAASASVLQGAGSTQVLSLSKGALHMMKLTKIKLAAAIVGAVIVGGTGGAWELRRAAADPPAQTDQTRNTPPAAVDTNELASVDEARPVVVSTIPQAGVNDVDPSITEIRVTFSKPMADRSWAFCKASNYAIDYPGYTGPGADPHYEADHRTCVLPVKLKPGKVYELLLNTERHMSFQDTQARTGVPYILVFGTRK